MAQTKPTELTVLVDTSVIMHCLSHRLKLIDHTKPEWKKLIQAQLTYLVSGDWLGEMKPDIVRYIFCTDSKPYWRLDYLKRPEVIANVPRKGQLEKKRQSFKAMLQVIEDLREEGKHFEARDLLASDEYASLLKDLEIHYKAGRKLSEYSFTKLKRFVLKTIKDAGWTMLSKKGYEADDMAASIIQVNKTLEEPKNIMMLTIDTDWLGMVSDNVHWFCQHGYYPRMRDDMRSLNIWATKRLGVTIEKPTDIWVVKGDQGDKADNIPPSKGALLPVIDLFNPPQEFKLWENERYLPTLLKALTTKKYYKVNSQPVISYINSCGVNLCVMPYNSHKDIARGEYVLE